MHFLFLLFACALFGVGCLPDIPEVPPPPPGPIACTADAKQCPDGSYVGRVPPSCEFAPCPSYEIEPTGRPCSGPGDTSCGRGYECTQECGPPVARDTDPPPGYSCYPAGRERICPICLAASTMIDTPAGKIRVTDLRVGMEVWTLDANGKRVAAPILETGKTAVPPDHRVVHLVLIDGREVWASPNHPTMDKGTIGDLKDGDAFDGSVVKSTERIPYTEGATYDLLPAGDTGAYWANGILMDSTL